MRAIIRGPLLSMSGYGNHSREVYRWLSQKKNVSVDTQILPWGITPWHINPDELDGMIGGIMQNSVSPQERVEQYDISFQVQLPNEWDSNIAKFNVGVTAAVETDTCHKSWATYCNTMNLVVVPSEHTKKTLESCGTITTPIIVIQESFIDAISDESIQPLELDLRTNFNFLIFGQLTAANAYVDRKNTFFTLKWLLEAFDGVDDVGVIIKTNNGRNTSVDRKNCAAIISQVTKEIGSTVPVYFLHGSMTNDEVAGLYRNKKIKALVSATRGEGFGLPLLEAAASELPVIATNWSAHKEFLNLGKWVSLDYSLIEVPKMRVDGNIFVENSKWAEVNEDDFKKKLKKFHKSPSKPKEWAAELSKKLQENYSFDSVSSIWDEAIQKYLRL